MKKSKHRFWIEIQNKEDFSPDESYIILSEDDFQTLLAWIKIQAHTNNLQPPQVHFWNLNFKSESPYDA